MPNKTCTEFGTKGTKKGRWMTCPACGARIKLFSSRDRLPVHFEGEVAS